GEVSAADCELIFGNACFAGIAETSGVVTTAMAPDSHDASTFLPCAPRSPPSICRERSRRRAQRALHGIGQARRQKKLSVRACRRERRRLTLTSHCRERRCM